MIRCPICTAENPDTERFCQECGQRLPISARSPDASNSGAPAAVVASVPEEPAHSAASIPSVQQAETSPSAPPPAPPTGLSVTAAPVQPSTAGVSPPAAPTLLQPVPSVSEQAPTTALLSTRSPIVQLPVDETAAPVSAEGGPPSPLVSKQASGEVISAGSGHIVDEPPTNPTSPDIEPMAEQPSAQVSTEEAVEPVPELGPESGHEEAVQVSPEAMDAIDAPVQSESPDPGETVEPAPANPAEAPEPLETPIIARPPSPDEVTAPAVEAPLAAAEAGVGQQRDGIDCPRCGVRNESNFRFCKACGTPLPPPVEANAPAHLLTEMPAADVFGEVAPGSLWEVPATIPIEPPLIASPPAPFPSLREEPVTTSPSPLLCPSCGKPGLEGERFCSECGARLAPVQPTSGGGGCPSCGAAFEPGDKFCKSCGTRLPTSVASGPRLVLASSGEQKTFALQGGQLTIGRAPGNDISITSDGYISSHHARIVVEDGKVYVEDAGSTNGTFLRVRSRTELSNGDEVKVGQSILRYQQG